MPPAVSKRKSSTPQRQVVELVPKDSPWTPADWWNETSQTCRPLVEAICSSLEHGTSVLSVPMEEDDEVPEAEPSPKGVDKFPRVVAENDEEDEELVEIAKAAGDTTEAKTEKTPPKILFDRGYVEYIPKTSGGGVFAVFHEGWGKLLNASEPWSIVAHRDEVHAMHLKHAIRKPPGLFAKHSRACIATLEYNHDEEDEATKDSTLRAVPIQLAANHLKVADFQFSLLKARNQVKNRKSDQVRSLKMDLANGKTVDIFPILRVIVDDENGQVFVEDALEVLDALIGFAGLSIPSFSEDEEDEDEEEEPKKKIADMWKVEHEVCGDIKQLTAHWLQSNKVTAQSFVSLCLENVVPEEPKDESSSSPKPTERTAVRSQAAAAAKRKAAAPRKDSAPNDDPDHDEASSK
eukprot:CAMPEP_0172460062 /NCGR_PEP_ID=MMETSP1065-20121228/35330_1 /TAXON_ID=265537 /ORGANISM="Amphiprora paludosa, Strain CCMP125" /LENGTH=405 /DNA_ID=CAMNT_0013214965 /DNA_START=60 /DNA_END=1278 /DNA_ORIENTATION=+